MSYYAEIEREIDGGLLRYTAWIFRQGRSYPDNQAAMTVTMTKIGARRWARRKLRRFNSAPSSNARYGRNVISTIGKKVA